MGRVIEVKVPDIGDFSDVDIIDVMVSAGDGVSAEDPLITLESDKATMEVPCPHAGVVRDVKVKAGDKVSEGVPIIALEVTEATEAATAPQATASAPNSATPAVGSGAGHRTGSEIETDILVLGAGPGGYTAAFRAADLGQRTVLVERYPNLGGVCLNVGCIPSKAYLHAAEVINEAEEMAERGIAFGPPRLEPAKIAAWKNGVVRRLTQGLAGLAKQRKVQVVQGLGRFESPNQVAVATADGPVTVHFKQAIIAAGSRPTQIPGFPHDDPRVWDSTDALELPQIPERLLIVGGGIIGLEMATVFDALKARISVVELLDGLIPECDRDLVRPLHKRVARRYDNIWLKTRVTNIVAQEAGLNVSFEGSDAPSSAVFDAVLVAVGRAPNGHLIGAERAGVRVDERGFIPADKQQRTNVAHIFAIGDVIGQPMLAHKAVHEGKVAAEVAAGLKSQFDARAIPNVAYTDPEVAWMGLTETQAKAEGISYEKGAFPWAASGRSLGMGRDEGLTKILFDPETRRILGAGVVGPHAGDLISETVLALEMGADAEDIGLSIHPHPTLSETVCFAAEMAEGTITDLYVPRK